MRIFTRILITVFAMVFVSTGGACYVKSNVGQITGPHVYSDNYMKDPFGSLDSSTNTNF